MSTNCLVTQLKSAVNNASLRKLGVVAIHIDNYNPSVHLENLYFNITAPITLKVSGNGFISDTRNQDGSLINPRTEMTKSTSGAIYFSSGTAFDIEVKEKYNVQSLGGTSQYALESGKWSAGLDIADCSYMNSLTVMQLVQTDSHGDVSNLKECPLTFVKLDINSGIIGDIKAFKGKEITTLSLGHTGVSGDLSGFASEQVQVLTNLDLYETGVSGSLEDFVTATGLASHSGIQVKFNTIDFGVVHSHLEGSLSWGDGKITIVGSTTVVEKGATAQEIAAWNAAGKTVTDAATGTVYPATS